MPQIDGMAMAISDRDARQTGLQFHPESILTPAGDRILANILTDPMTVADNYSATGHAIRAGDPISRA